VKDRNTGIILARGGDGGGEQLSQLSRVSAEGNPNKIEHVIYLALL
jgi:hypothetical protein